MFKFYGLFLIIIYAGCAQRQHQAGAEGAAGAIATLRALANILDKTKRQRMSACACENYGYQKKKTFSRKCCPLCLEKRKLARSISSGPRCLIYKTARETYEQSPCPLGLGQTGGIVDLGASAFSREVSLQAVQL